MRLHQCRSLRGDNVVVRQELLPPDIETVASETQAGTTALIGLTILPS